MDRQSRTKIDDQQLKSSVSFLDLFFKMLKIQYLKRKIRL